MAEADDMSYGMTSIARRAAYKWGLASDGAPSSPEGLAALAWRLRRRSEARSKNLPNHSRIWDVFPPLQIHVPPGHSANYFGTLWPAKFGLGEAPGSYVPPIPSITEEYFEFLDVLESIVDAGDSYTMLEWGAGFGRWTGLAIAAARRRGISNICVGLCEAEPVHAGWIREHMAELGMDEGSFRLYQVAMSGQAGEMLFMTGRPDGDDDPGDWYGQALGEGFNPDGFEPNGRDYHGVPELAASSGWRAIKVPTVPPSQILSDYDFVDLIDMDIQGAEADAVEECIELLNCKVRRLHIGTHSREIEVRLRAVLAANGWISIRDLHCLGESHTSFGRVECGDGVQSWFNPRFPPKDWVRSL